MPSTFDPHAPPDDGRPAQASTPALGAIVPVELPAELVHALRTPLGALSSALQVCALPADASVHESALAIARRQAQRLADQVSEIEAWFALQRLADVRTAPPLRPVALAPMLAGIWSGCLAGGACDLPAPACPPSTWVRAHADILRPAIAQLVRHALRQSLALEVRRDGDEVLLRAGTGLAADASADGRPADGLELARRVARLMGGDLALRPAVGGLLGFCLRLPSWDGPAAPF